MTTRRADALQPPDDDARALARHLARGSRHAALAVVEPSSGYPLASRVAVASDAAGDLILFVSGLSAHTAALREDGRCSLLLGDIQSGDPLAQPRLTAIGRASAVDASGTGAGLSRRRFLARHPRAAVYADLPDFALMHVRLERANLNAGFGRAFELRREDVVDPLDGAFAAAAEDAVDHMNADHAGAVDEIARWAMAEAAAGWRIATVDRRGFEIVRSEAIRRIEFDQPVTTGEGLRMAFIALLARARGQP